MRQQHLNTNINYKSVLLFKEFNRLLDEHGVEKKILIENEIILFDAKFLFEKSESIPVRFKATKKGYKLEFILTLDVPSIKNMVSSMILLEKVVPFKFDWEKGCNTTIIKVESRTYNKISFSKLRELVKKFKNSMPILSRMCRLDDVTCKLYNE